MIKLEEILVNVGLQIYCYLHPKDLLSFSLCNREYLWNDIIRDKLFKICSMHHLPLNLGVGTNYLAEFKEGCSFLDKAHLLDFVLDMTERADLLLVDTVSMDESRMGAREALLGDDNSDNSTLKFYSNSSNNNNSMERNITITVDCHYQSTTNKDSAISWTKYILDRDACKRSIKDKKTQRLIWAWLNMMFAQSNNSNISTVSFGLWRWTCKHQKLNGQGIAGVGVLFMKTDSNENTNDEYLELRLTRQY